MEEKKLKYRTYFYIVKSSESNNSDGHNNETWQVQESEPFENYVELSTLDPQNEKEREEFAKEKAEKERNEKVIVKVRNLTKDYGKGRGIFDVSFDVTKGTVFGYCGTNGSGKTTTLRHIMGFLKPQKGSVKVKGLDAWKDADIIKKYIGYLPGEIAFPQVESGSEFLKIQAESLGLKDMSKAEMIINALQLDPTANLRRMSKGMKQKTAIVAALMHSPEIIILDEPTTGLDPLMRDVFVNLIKAEKARGATIIMSNHMFDELEETCDQVAFIKDGRIVDIVDMNALRNLPYRDYVVTFENEKDYKEFNLPEVEVLERNDKELSISFRIELKKANQLIDEFIKRDIKSFTEKKHTLEEIFLKDVGGTNHE
ncbi:MAG: ATP-binding cassette domain-containing protein [Bacilli bacterium]|nr:ATP-binding cassette domain-containing protein [Bacilli bacterium]